MSEETVTDTRSLDERFIELHERIEALTARVAALEFMPVLPDPIGAIEC